MIESFGRFARHAGATAVAAAIAAWAAGASAQAPLVCSAATSGSETCQGQAVCRCVYNPGGTMIREPAGYRWDCGNLLYGTCPPGSPYSPLAGTVIQGGPVSELSARGGSDQVRAAQSQLARLGFHPGPVDGVVGPRTSDAIRAFQRAQHLPETGSLTPDTLLRLRAAG
jgi:hypothetical protein